MRQKWKLQQISFLLLWPGNDSILFLFFPFFSWLTQIPITIKRKKKLWLISQLKVDFVRHTRCVLFVILKYTKSCDKLSNLSTINFHDLPAGHFFFSGVVWYHWCSISKAQWKIFNENFWNCAQLSLKLSIN